MSDGKKAYVGNGAGDGDIRATTDVDGTILFGGAGNDILRGGRYGDILTGGSGDDQLFGGASGDQFRFFGDQIEGASDSDDVYDLNFGAGDTLVFGSFGAGTFSDSNGVNSFSSPTGADSAAIISSFEGIVNAAAFSDRVTAFREGAGNNNLVLQITDADGQIQNIVISNGYSQYIAAGGTDGL
jgi:Ca2+-binding RTX toxin-like protein